MKKLREIGLINFWQQKWWPRQRCSGIPVPEAHAITLLDTQSAFYLLLAGVVLATLMLGVEVIREQTRVSALGVICKKGPGHALPDTAAIPSTTDRRASVSMQLQTKGEQAFSETNGNILNMNNGTAYGGYASNKYGGFSPVHDTAMQWSFRAQMIPAGLINSWIANSMLSVSTNNQLQRFIIFVLLFPSSEHREMCVHIKDSLHAVLLARTPKSPWQQLYLTNVFSTEAWKPRAAASWQRSLITLPNGHLPAVVHLWDLSLLYVHPLHHCILTAHWQMDATPVTDYTVQVTTLDKIIIRCKPLDKVIR